MKRFHLDWYNAKTFFQFFFYQSGYAKPFEFSEVWIYSPETCRVSLDTRSTYVITGSKTFIF